MILVGEEAAEAVDDILAKISSLVESAEDGYQNDLTEMDVAILNMGSVFLASLRKKLMREGPSWEGRN